VTLQQEVTLAVHAFIAAVMALARQAAVAAVESAMSVWAPIRAQAGAQKPLAAAARLAKRSPSDLKAQSERLVSFIERNPGLRVEQINRALGTETRELALPIRRLVAIGALRVQGRKRSTRYYVAANHAHHLHRELHQTRSAIRA
jgi:hypothetical protein